MRFQQSTILAGQTSLVALAGLLAEPPEHLQGRPVIWSRKTRLPPRKNADDA